MLPVLEILKNKRVVLGSGSPRRAEILRNIGLDFDIAESGFDENLSLSDFPSFGAFVEEIAFQKAMMSLKAAGKPTDLVIAADTIVTKGQHIYGKPGTASRAREMLTELSNQWHEVHTGVALILKNGFDFKTFHETTKVKMSLLELETINAYVATGEPLDKAGAYGIQGLGGTLVERIEGDFYNVVGFPLYSFCKKVEMIKQHV